MKLNNDKDLIFFISEGIPEATQELYQRYASKLYGFLLQFLRDEAIAKDILHDTFETVILKAKKYNDNFAVSTWLFTIASNQAKNWIKKQAKFSEIKEEQLVTSENDIVELPLNSAINRLESKQREVILLKYQEGFLIEEISQILDIAEGTVKSRLFNAHRRLNTLLKQYE